MSDEARNMDGGYIVQCPRCGGKNRVGAHGKGLRPVCAACRTELPRPKRAYGAMIFWTVVVLAIIGATSFHVYRRYWERRAILAAQAQEWAELTAAHAARLAELHAAHAAKLADPAYTSGALAAEAHGGEMEQRRNFDPAFASSAREKTILEMAALAEGKELPEQDILKKVAQLSAPSGAEVLVMRSNAGEMVFVNFDMAVLTHGEHGARTKHKTKEALRREIETLIAQVFKDLFIHCGRKNIASVAVGCKHGVTSRGDYGLETVDDKVLLLCRIVRKQADKVRDWRGIHADEIARRWTVVQDYFPSIQLVETSVPAYQRLLPRHADPLDSLRRRQRR